MCGCDKLHLCLLAREIVVRILNVNCDDDDLHTVAHCDIILYFEAMVVKERGQYQEPRGRDDKVRLIHLGGSGQDKYMLGFEPRHVGTKIG